MGLFSDKCVNCGADVSKKARFCSKCGHPAPKGWVKCPSCHEWIGNDSKFCPRCNHPLHPEERIDLAGGVWCRKPGAFAQRVEIEDVTGMAKSGLKIQEGTLAILLDAGRKSAILGPGRHSVEGSLRNVNWFGNPPPRSVVMVDSGDCVFRMDFRGMRTAEELSVDVVAEVTLRFDAGEANAFLANVMKENRDVTAEEMCRWLESDATEAVKDLCAQSTVEDLVKDPERRPRFEDAIGRALKALLKRSGLALVRVGYVDFISPVYEEMRKRYGDLDFKRRQLEYDRKVNEFIIDGDRAAREFGLTRRTEALEGDYKELVVEAEADDKALDLEARRKREDARRRQDTEEYLAQLAQEKGLSGVSRDAELAIANRIAAGQIDAKKAEEELAALARVHEREFAEAEHKFELERRTREHERSEALEAARGQNAVRDELRADEQKQAVHAAGIGEVTRSEKTKDAQADAGVERIKIDTRNYEAKSAQEIAQAGQENNIRNLAAIKAMESEERRKLAELVKGKSALEIAAIESDPEKCRQLMELARQELARTAEKERLEAERSMTAEQILARQAGASEAAAGAFAAKVQADAQIATAKAAAEVAQHDALTEEMKRMMEKRVEHDEIMMRMLHDVAAKAVEKPVTVVGSASAQPATLNVVK